MTTQTLSQVTPAQVQILAGRLQDITGIKTRNHIKRMRLDIMLEDLELLYGVDGIQNHPAVNWLYETIQEEREAVMS